jgi:hypothetical protein
MINCFVFGCLAFINRIILLDYQTSATFHDVDQRMRENLIFFLSFSVGKIIIKKNKK